MKDHVQASTLTVTLHQLSQMLLALKKENNIHSLLRPYCKPVNIVRNNGSVRQIQSLRDTGAMQSLLKDTHNSKDYVITDKTTLLKGITTQTQRVPLVQVHLCTCLLYTSPSPRD